MQVWAPRVHSNGVSITCVVDRHVDSSFVKFHQFPTTRFQNTPSRVDKILLVVINKILPSDYPYVYPRRYNKKQVQE